VFFIQNERRCSRGQEKSIPWSSSSWVRYIRPRVRAASVSASSTQICGLLGASGKLTVARPTSAAPPASGGQCSAGGGSGGGWSRAGTTQCGPLAVMGPAPRNLESASGGSELARSGAMAAASGLAEVALELEALGLSERVHPRCATLSIAIKRQKSA